MLYISLSGGYVFIGVSLLAVLCKNYLAAFNRIWWKGGTWATEEPVRF